MTDSFWGLFLLAVGTGIQVLFAIFVLLRPHDLQPSSLAWILVIIILPGFGIVLYLILGEVRTDSKRRLRHRSIQSNIRSVAARAWRQTPAEGVVPDVYLPIARLAADASDAHPRGGNRLTLLADATNFVASLVADIESAEQHVHLLYYIYLDDTSGRKVAEALSRAAARGVECRLLVDSVGSKDFLRSALRQKIEAAGVTVVGALPTRITQIVRIRFDMRNHRKVAVIDGAIGYTGSHNVADEAFHPKPSFAPWIDATLRIEGPAVRDLQALFVADWFMDTGRSRDHLLLLPPTPHTDGSTVQIAGTGPNTQNQLLVQVIQSALHLAREEVILTTPYFVPDEGTFSALITAAMRGVHTTLVVPLRNDSPLVGLASRSYYARLLGAGVEIMEYADGLLHAKTMTVDRNLAMVTTANFDRRSFEINFELSTLVYDSDFASQLRLLQRTYMEDSVALDPQRWSDRKWPGRLAENLAGLVSPLL